MPDPNDAAAPASGAEAAVATAPEAPASEPDSPQAGSSAAAPASEPVSQSSAAPTEHGTRNTAPPDSIRPYDFRHPVFLTPADLRRLRMRQEECVRALAARLSIYLRLEFLLRLASLETVPYRKFAETTANPTHLSLFKVEPLRGIGLLEIHPRLGLAIVDRLLGGPAQLDATPRDFSEIELALLEQTVQLILSEWCQHWAGVQALRPVLLGHENSGRFLQTAPHDTVMLVLGLEAKLAECNDPMRLALPCSTLEPLIRKLGQASQAAEPSSAALAPTPKWNRNFDEVPVSVTALWDDLVLTAREVANLKPGDILPLDPRSARCVKLRLADRSKFQGTLGTTGGKWAVAVTDAVHRALGD